MSGILSRGREIVHRRGVSGTMRVAVERLSPLTTWSDEYVWYVLDLRSSDRPRRPLEPPLVLRRGGEEDVALLEQLPADESVTSMSREIVAERLAAGAMLWLVTEGDRAAFSCWTFAERGPLRGAKGGTVELPPEAVLLEDSLSSPDFRGRGVAPGAWTGIADFHAAMGVAEMVTKVREDNAASRRAVEKVGFREVARMRRSGPLWRPQVAVAFSEERPQHRWLGDLRRG